MSEYSARGQIQALSEREILTDLLSYHDRLDQRQTETIDLVVLHATELPGMREAREFGERIQHPSSQTGNSGHYYVDRDGAITRYVHDHRVAHHARDFNERSLGIELVNLGRYPHWFHPDHQVPSEPFPEEQLTALERLLRWLHQQHPQLRGLAAHADLDLDRVPASGVPGRTVRRKIDPGPLFPWSRVLASVDLPRLRRAVGEVEEGSGSQLVPW